MHFYNIINELSKNQKISLYVDMDGVIASYDAGKKLDFKNKRPLTENINKLETKEEVEMELRKYFEELKH